MKKLVAILALTSTLSLTAIAGGDHQHGDALKERKMQGTMTINILQMTKMQHHLRSIQKIVTELEQHPAQNNQHLQSMQLAMNMMNKGIGAMVSQMMAHETNAKKTPP